MASSVAECLREILQRYIPNSGAKASDGAIRLVLAGPPTRMLRELFTLLTHDNQSPWQPSPQFSLPVFLVSQNPVQSDLGPSCECNWDYALTVRNSYTSFILLVDTFDWDERTYSIVNATDTIGTPLSAIKRPVPRLEKWNMLYAQVVRIVARETAISYQDLQDALQECLRDLPALEPLKQQSLPWEIVDQWVRLPVAGIPATADEISADCGLPSSTNGATFKQRRKLLERLGDFLDDNGIRGGIEELKETTNGSQVATHLDSFEEHVRREAASAEAFRRVPSYYYRCPRPRPAWWQALTLEELEQMLAEVGQAPTTERLSIDCINALNRHSQIPGEPYLVPDSPQLKITHTGGQFQSLRLSRRIGRRQAVLLETPGTVASPWTYTEVSAPEHDSFITYIVEDTGALTATVSVVSLAQFEPAAFISCTSPGALKIGKPRRSSPSEEWEQQLELRSGGIKVFRAYCASEVARLRTQDPDLEAEVTEDPVDFQIEIDDDIDIPVSFLDASGQSLSTIRLSVTSKHEEQNTAFSFFEALVRTHQEGRNDPLDARATDSWLRRAEFELLATHDSWMPVLACPGWSDSNPHLLSASTRTLGDVIPQVEPRPSLSHSALPDDFLAAREQVRQWLSSKKQQLPEIDLTGDDVRLLAVDYLESYHNWIESAAELASWTDVIAVLERESVQYGQQAYAVHEPIAVLLSPLHPLRFAWQVGAQYSLSKALEVPCPLAGLLDPHRCPDILALPLSRSGGVPTWKPYISVSCQDALWGLFWNATRIREFQNHESIIELARVGAVPRGVQTGFTATQAKRTLEEITRVLPTRTVMRLGIVSSGSSGSSCSDGLMSWCRERYENDNEIVTGPHAIEVFDTRTEASRPLREEIASLADDTAHRVRWFAPGQCTSKDLVIIDHLGIAGPSPENHEWRSPSSEGSLVRNRLRMDRNLAEWVIESRTGTNVQSEDSLLDQIGMAANLIETLAATQTSTSHIAFTPNPEVIGTELQDTRFLAVSSAEIDPACFARGTPRTGGYLWDYELPQAQGAGEQRSGFYMLARPPDSIKRAVQSALRLVTQTDIDVDNLLMETSRRGIPILKRLSAGGSQAKGELGMLLTVRLLQDAFRGEGMRVRLPVADGNSVHMVLPIDPWADPVVKVRNILLQDSDASRPDLLLVCIRMESGQSVSVRLVPIEVKFRESVMSHQGKVESLQQARNFGNMLYQFLQATPRNELWKLCSRGFLAEILDYGFRVYGDKLLTRKEPDEWATMHQNCLSGILDGTATITVASEGRLFVVDDSPITQGEDIDGDGYLDTVVINREDVRALLEDDVSISETADQIVELLELCGPAENTTDTALETMHSVESEAGAPQNSEIQPSGSSLFEDSVGQINTTPSSDASVVPNEVRRQVNEGFEGFVGNRAAVVTLKRAMLRALLTTPPQLPASYLFTGNPSTGKTELARRVASCLELPFVSLDGRALRSRDRLFDLVDGALSDVGQIPTQVGTRYQRPLLNYPPLVVFIDEVHLVPRAVQESLLTALEPNDRSVLLSNKVALLQKATFLFATTRPSDVDTAFRTRCMEIPLQDYSEEEVAAIVGIAQPNWPDTVRLKIAKYGRLVPRIALELVREVASESLVSEYTERTLEEHLEEVKRTRLIDGNGLGPVDIEYLELLEREARPLGERNILAMLTNIDKNRVTEEVEPLVIARLRLAKKTDRGREITPDGRRYLLELRRQQQNLR
ncbi:MAG: AAA family ATPase [Gemmatimonadetes bacterium]|nr:AAA family ATPase [Gemmatimonadota bacterium]